MIMFKLKKLIDSGHTAMAASLVSELTASADVKNSLPLLCLAADTGDENLIRNCAERFMNAGAFDELAALTDYVRSEKDSGILRYVTLDGRLMRAVDGRGRTMFSVMTAMLISRGGGELQRFIEDMAAVRNDTPEGFLRYVCGTDGGENPLERDAPVICAEYSRPFRGFSSSQFYGCFAENLFDTAVRKTAECMRAGKEDCLAELKYLAGLTSRTHFGIEVLKCDSIITCPDPQAQLDAVRCILPPVMSVSEEIFEKAGHDRIFRFAEMYRGRIVCRIHNIYNIEYLTEVLREYQGTVCFELPAALRMDISCIGFVHPSALEFLKSINVKVICTDNGVSDVGETLRNVDILKGAAEFMLPEKVSLGSFTLRRSSPAEVKKLMKTFPDTEFWFDLNENYICAEPEKILSVYGGLLPVTFSGSPDERDKLINSLLGKCDSAGFKTLIGNRLIDVGDTDRITEILVKTKNVNLLNDYMDMVNEGAEDNV